jgi:hypothetical protein
LKGQRQAVGDWSAAYCCRAAGQLSEGEKVAR